SQSETAERLRPIAHQLPVILRVAVRNFLKFRESAHAMTTSSPDIFIRGTPPDVSAMTTAGALDPSGLTMRARTSAPSGVLSTQLTRAFPEGRARTSTYQWPCGFVPGPWECGFGALFSTDPACSGAVDFSSISTLPSAIFCNCLISSGVRLGERRMKETSAQMDSGLSSPPNAGIPVKRTPFEMM